MRHFWNIDTKISAFALCAATNQVNWDMFVKDCEAAFKTPSGTAVRPWRVFLADGDGVIHSCVSNNVPGIIDWQCWKHFRERIQRDHPAAAARAYYEPLHEVMYQLMTTDNPTKYHDLELRSTALLAQIPMKQASLYQKESAMLMEVISTRKLALLKVFSNGYIADSIAEVALV